MAQQTHTQRETGRQMKWYNKTGSISNKNRIHFDKKMGNNRLFILATSLIKSMVCRNVLRLIEYQNHRVSVDCFVSSSTEKKPHNHLVILLANVEPSFSCKTFVSIFIFCSPFFFLASEYKTFGFLKRGFLHKCRHITFSVYTPKLKIERMKLKRRREKKNNTMTPMIIGIALTNMMS